MALGGDGTVNEVVNGLLADQTGTGAGAPRPDPHATAMLAVVPGGSANVFARALGIPRDPVEATAAVLSALAARRHRMVGLGHGPTTAGSRSTPAWAGTPRSSPPSSGRAPRGTRRAPAGTR